ncbi:MAG: LysE family transporter [Spirochaetes bacterium]|nr:LysE family transporter [Spirochaetota bacterium]
MINYFISAFVLGVIVAIPPGSVTVIACQRAIQYGFRNSLIFTIGSSLADILYICLVYFGLTNFIHDDANRLALIVLCGILLILIGGITVASARAGSGGEAREASKLQSRPLVTFASGIAVTLTNPMTIIGWIAIAGNFFILWRDRVPGSAGFAVVTVVMIMAGVLAWFIPLIYGASRLHRIINPSVQRYLIAISGFCLIIFGLISLVSAYQGSGAG